MVTQQLTTFIGRTQELAEIAVLLADPACRLLTLVGPGGIGKTRLVLEAINPSLNPSLFHGEEFKDGVHFVPLQPITDTALLPITIAHVIGIQIFGAEEPGVQLVNYLQERQILLILDNFEHLIDGVDFVVELLSASGVKLLVTSRTALNIQAEWRYAVTGLDVPNDAHEIEIFDAIKLFSERARRLRHDFSLDEQRTHVIRICQLTEGMPLALELAAGWLKVLSCAEIAHEIQRGLDFLAADARDIPERHRSMAVVYSQSWALLTDDEQKIFQRMSIFRGGFTREAAEKVTDANLQILASLVDKSFLRIDTAAGRYDIHELLRQYGEAKLEAAGEIEGTRDTHSIYYLDFLARRDADIKGRRQIAALNEIEADFENVRAAWYHAVTKRNDQAIGGAVECLTWFSNYRNRVLEYEELCSRAQEQFAPLPGEQPSLVWAQIMVRRASRMMMYQRSDEKLALSRSFYKTGLDILRLYDDRLEMAIATLYWGMLLAITESPDALIHIEQSLSDFQAMDNPYYVSECWCWIGIHYRNLNRIEQFFYYMQLCADLKLKLGEKSGGAWILSEISDVQYDQGDYAAAEQNTHEALHLFREIINLSGIAASTLQFALRAFWKGDLEEAHDLAEEALKYVANTTSIADFFVGEILTYIQCIVDEDYEQSLRHSKDLYKSRSQHLNFLELMALCGLGHFERAKQQLSVIPGRARGYLNALVTIQVLTIDAIILANQGEEQRAVELFGLLFAQPIEWIGWIKHWGLVRRLLDHLQADLGSQMYADAWECGKNADFGATFAQMIVEFGVSENNALSDTNHMSLDPLTPRELDVLRLVAQGRSNRQIAEALVIANTTVRGYVHIICQKLGAQNRTHAIVRARELHLL